MIKLLYDLTYTHILWCLIERKHVNNLPFCLNPKTKPILTKNYNVGTFGPLEASVLLILFGTISYFIVTNTEQ